MSRKFWITPGEGVVEEKSDGSYSNELFVSSARKSTSAMSNLILSRFPTETVVKLGDGIPDSWVPIEKVDISPKKVDSLIDGLPDEMDTLERLSTSRRVLSDRIRQVCSHAGLSVTPRGIKDCGMSRDIHIALSELVYCAYLTVERYTTSSLNGDEKKIVKDKREKMERILDIVSSRKDILESIMVNAYVEPSPIIVNRLFSLGAIYGVENVNTVVNDVYYRQCRNQVKSIEGLEDFL